MLADVSSQCKRFQQALFPEAPKGCGVLFVGKIALRKEALPKTILKDST